MRALRDELEVSGSVGAPEASREVGRGFRVSSECEGLGHMLPWKVPQHGVREPQTEQIQLRILTGFCDILLRVVRSH